MTLSKTLKQSLVVIGLMTVGLMVFQMFSGIALAGSAGEFIGPESNVVGTSGSLRDLVLKIVNFFLGFLGLLAVIMVIYGGFLYISSAGNDEKVGQAKKILLYAVLGIVVIVVSFALVNTLLKGLGGGTDVGVS